MAQKTQLTQDEVNRVWSNEWRKQRYSARELFGQRLFVEGYPVLKKYLPDDPRMILDVGAATGRYSIRMAQDYPDATIFATDILEESLDIIHGLVEETGVTNVRIRREDATKLTFPDDHFDVVYSGMLLQILPDVDAAMREMRRVLKPGGVLIASTVNIWNFHSLNKAIRDAFNMPEYYEKERAFSRKELFELFRRHGLQPVALDGFYPAYGIYRLKMYWKPFALIGRIINRANRIIDPWTNRFFSRHFGFEILCVGRKI